MRLAAVHFARQAGESGGNSVGVAGAVADGNCETLAGAQSDAPAAYERARANFRSAQIGQDGDGLFQSRPTASRTRAIVARARRECHEKNSCARRPFRRGQVAQSCGGDSLAGPRVQTILDRRKFIAECQECEQLFPRDKVIHDAIKKFDALAEANRAECARHQRACAGRPLR